MTDCCVLMFSKSVLVDRVLTCATHFYKVSDSPVYFGDLLSGIRILHGSSSLLKFFSCPRVLSTWLLLKLTKRANHM
jgi:hypothetical protein